MLKVIADAAEVPVSGMYASRMSVVLPISWTDADGLRRTAALITFLHSSRARLVHLVTSP